MNYYETVDYLFSQLPMFQRIGAAAYKADLSNTIALCEILGNPQHKFKSVHVAGTNGKGSVSSALASIFSTAGFKTGLFTSPHMKDYRERIRIDGEMIPEQHVVEFVAKYQMQVNSIKPSFFELTCAMAFEYFAEQNVDIAILEVGMGGRLDSTNVVIPEVSVITSIGLDHQQFLGDTIEKIAAEKGGIIKPGVPVVIGENPPEVVEVLKEIAARLRAPSTLVHVNDTGIKTDLGGIYQAENMRTVHAAVKILRQKGWNLSDAAVQDGAMHVVKNTGLRGRWETLSRDPLIVADVGHNEEGVAMAMEMLSHLPEGHRHIVWGMVSDKDAAAIFKLLPKDASYYWCRPDVPRGKDAEILKTEAAQFALHGHVYHTVSEALAAARRVASKGDVIFVGGSVFVVAEALHVCE
jgi:dihydrofolate synthase/folylpolyglutamate synthase